MESSYYERFVGTTPEQIFKYFSINDNLKNSLAESYLWLSHPTDFNDPFDCYENLISYNVTGRAIEGVVKNRVPGNRHERRKQVRHYKKRSKSFKKALESTLPDIIRQQGICCFSRTHESILMWSHYADKHRGLCIGFNPRKSMTTFPLLDVKYETNFKSHDYFSDKSDALLNMLITKSED